ncbi:MAG: hypothetical protein JHC87_07505, partial [Thermoleophilaceae bacterium]|nr:hypothetical protein [Thermoleophilaceae bacterium]
MNDSIKRVALAIVLLFGLLLAFTSRWTVFEADQLQSNSLNKLPLLREQQQPRGRILARDRHLIARSVRRGRGGQATYLRRYAPPTLYAHPVGYYDVELRSTGLERYYDDQLSNNREELLTLLDQLLARKPEGRDMTTALDPVAQQLAGAQLAGRAGAVVVIEPATGRVPVYVSSPSYNQNLIRNPAAFAALNKSDKKVLFDRVGQAAYPPGSTFKVVTAAAALDQALYNPSSVLNGNSPQTFSGQPLSNSGGKSWGDISLTTALTHSVNTVWAQVGEKLGNETLFDYMQRFGFGAKPPIDL